MIYLVGRIFLYLLVATLIGGVAGWQLVRRRMQRQLDLERRTVSAARLELSQREQELTRLSQRVDELESLPAAVPSADTVEVEALRDQLAQRFAELDAMRRAFEELKQEQASAHMNEEAGNNLITVLHAEIARLRAENEALKEARPKSPDDLTMMVRDLEGRLVRKLNEIDRLQQSLAGEERKVLELERERELQDKSLHVLHQQLELERMPKRAAG
ncbi:MAG: hypothetical protein H6993_06150 [Pseudomonadales bacterium]|nr:hypothetical protein [Pseudomonadales bacterium]MCP5183526.1 hypothetical protein [Pseudomonadales bacterium]